MRVPLVEPRSRSSDPFAVKRMTQWLRDTVGSVRRKWAPSAPPIRISSASSVTCAPLSRPFSTLSRTFGKPRVFGPLSVVVGRSDGRMGRLSLGRGAKVDDERGVLLGLDADLDHLPAELGVFDRHLRSARAHGKAQ